MVVQVNDLSTLDPALVANFDASLTALLLALNPNLELRSGLLHDLLLHLKAILDADTQTNINLIVQSSSLKQITANPTQADDTVVDNLLSNYNITRSAGTKATGSVTIVLNQLVGVVIPSTTIFTINGITFTPTITIAARTSAGSVVTSHDVLITAGPIVASVQYYIFNVPVIAVAGGVNGNVAQGTTATMSSNPPFFVQAYAASSFTGGTDAGTNQALLDKLASGAAIKAWSNRPSILGLITAQAEFASISNISVIGFGDPEMSRDQHAIWPGSLGGHTDLYLQSQPIYTVQSLQVTATLISKVGALGMWQFGVGRNDVPGFYSVNKILLPSQLVTAVGFVITSDGRSLDLSAPVPTSLGPIPDLKTTLPAEGVYSRYQAAVIRFNDTLTDASALTIGVATQIYNVTFNVMPLVAELQDFLLQRSVRPPMCDVLVKGAIPCFTTMAITINYRNGTTAPSVTTIQNTVAAAVNSQGFIGTLATSFIQNLLYSTIDNIVSVASLTMVGNIRNPSGTITVIIGTPNLTINDDLPNMVTGRTTLFFLQPVDITVTLVPVIVPNV